MKFPEYSSHITQFPVLYGASKGGSIKQWKIWTSGADIHVEHGKMDGKKQLSIKTAKGKNTGKANETTPEQQAELQAESMWKKKIDKGYRETVDEAKEPVLLPMKAQDFEDRKSKITYPVDVQPKLNGVRCLGFWEGNNIRLLSRGNKDWHLDNVQAELSCLIDRGQVVDGEIYWHGKSLMEIQHLVTNLEDQERNKLKLHIYDTFPINNPDIPWAGRRKYLRRLATQVNDSNEGYGALVIVPSFVAYNEPSVYEYQKSFVRSGYEGAIVRLPTGKYELNHRSSNLLKVKSFMDAEFEVAGFTEGEGKDKGCVVWICKNKDGQEFNVRPKGSLEERKVFFQNGNKYIGKFLKVKFFEYTDYNIPQFPVGLEFRLPEDME